MSSQVPYAPFIFDKYNIWSPRVLIEHNQIPFKSSKPEIEISPTGNRFFFNHYTVRYQKFKYMHNED